MNSEIQNDTALGRLMHDFHCKKADDMYYEVLAEQMRIGFDQKCNGIVWNNS